MRIVVATLVSLVVLAGPLLPSVARADEPSYPEMMGSASAPVVRAREMLTRAKSLYEAATADENEATELDARLPALRKAAHAAREKAVRATGADEESLTAHAETLEADLAISEAELAMKRRTAAEGRRAARDLRARAVRLARGVSTTPEREDAACESRLDARRLSRLDGIRSEIF